MILKNVVSAFDGMSGAALALEMSNIEWDNYYALEIDKYPIKVSKDNFPGITHLGDIKEFNYQVEILKSGRSGCGSVDLEEYLSEGRVDYQIRNHFVDLEDNFTDLLIGGSPCQSFSRIGNGKGFDGKSGLFWEFLKLKENLNPKYFLFENVIPKKKEWIDIISEALGVEPIMIPSKLFVPQRRERLYWTNIPIKGTPKQVDYNVQNYIMDGDGFPSCCGKKDHTGMRKMTSRETFNTITATYYKGIGASGRAAVSKKEGYLQEDRDSHRMLTVREIEKLQGVKEGYCKSVSKTRAYEMLGNGFTIPVISWILDFIK